MNQNSAKTQKVSMIVLLIVRIVQAILILSVVMSIVMWILPSGSFMPRIDKRGDYLSTALMNSGTAAIVFAALCAISGLLQSLKSNSTPFTKENVKRLKMISVLLIVIEPVQMIFGSIANALRPLTANGEKVMSVTSMGGMVIVLGLIVFCLSLVFEHGVELQKQSDETL
nr:DUF2975 domain-containing protein [uncultured Caproiciproducens sp.]